MLDSSGIALASTDYDFAHRTLNAARSLGGPGDHAVIGMATRLPLRDAALTNGVLIHGLDYDDTHIQAATHITCSLLPTAIGVAAQEGLDRSEEHTSELQSLMRISYAVFCLKKKKQQ